MVNGESVCLNKPPKPVTLSAGDLERQDNNTNIYTMLRNAVSTSLLQRLGKTHAGEVEAL